MSRDIAIFDTSLLCCWLKVPGRESTGSGPDLWNSNRVSALVSQELENGSTIVLPLATIIETGNHISQAPTERFRYATELSKHIKSAAQSESPWAAFADQSILWETSQMLVLAEEWPKLADAKMSLEAVMKL